MQILLYLNSNTFYICSKCLIDILPFQQVCDVEFKEMFYQNIFQQITSTLNNEPNLDDLIKPNCKYWSVEWYKKCLTNSKNQNDLCIIHFNVRSIVKNKHILELIHELDNFPDIRTISKTRFNKNNINHASIQNYKFVFSNSTINAGGVAIYVLSNLKYSRRYDLEFQSAGRETVFIELNLAANKKIIVGVIYRHPTNTFNEFQDLLLQTLNKRMDHEKYDYFLCGDFNIDILKHESKEKYR